MVDQSPCAETYTFIAIPAFESMKGKGFPSPIYLLNCWSGKAIINIKDSR